MIRIRLCGEITVEAAGGERPILGGRQGRLAFAFLVAERHRSVSREELADVLWPAEVPASWTTSLSAVVSKLRRFLTDLGLDGTQALASAFGSYHLNLPEDTWVDVEAAADAVSRAERALVERDAASALVAALEAREIAAGDFPMDESHWGQDFRSRLRDLRVRAVHAQAEAILAAGDARRAIEPAQEVVALEQFREAGYRVLMRAYAAAGERAEALRTWERCKELLSNELGTDPAPETEAVYLEILRAEQEAGLPTGVVTFLLTDIERSSELWEAGPDAMNVALEQHDRRIAETVERNGGHTVKGMGDGTLAVFRRATGAAAAALELRDAFTEGDLRVRFALHSGEAFERDGDYFGPTVNRVARLASAAAGGQIFASQATVELLRDQDIPIRDLGKYELKGASRAVNVFELGVDEESTSDATARERPSIPAALSGAGPFVGRSGELDQLMEAWVRAKDGVPRAVLLGGEPGVGKTRLSGECARRAHDDGALVLYGRCDEDLGAPYQPFAQAARTVVDYWGPGRLRSLSGVEELARLVPEITAVLPGLPSPTRGDPEQERYVLFDALARLLVQTSMDTPVVLVLDDLHWAAKPTLLLLRHILRFASQARLLIVGTYRDTELDRTHPLAGVLVDLHRDEVVDRISLSGLDVDAVAEYVAASGREDARLARAVADVTSGIPFFMIEVLRHIEESGGEWDARTLPQGVKEATGRRLSRLSADANDALLVGAIAGSVFSVDLVEKVSEIDCIECIEEARQAGLVLEGDTVGEYRFAHALVRQVLLSEVATVKRVRLHLKIAAALEETGADEAELAHHYFECAWAGHAGKAAEYCSRAANRAMERLAYEEATDLYDKALQSMDVDPEAFTDEDRAELLLMRCEAALAAGDVRAASASVEALERVAKDSRRLKAWATTFGGQLAILVHPDKLRDTERAVAGAARELSELGDLSGAAQAHTVHAMCLFNLGRVAECETSLDAALTAARAANDHRRVNAMLAQAPVAALAGPSPVPRAGGRCLDIVRQLRITTGSPAVEAVATRCQAALEAYRGRAPAARRMLETARETLEQLGHRVGLLEIDLFAGLVELVVGEPAEAETYLRRAYDGFKQLGLDAEVAGAAARLARACLRLGRADEADALSAEAERLGGNAAESAVVWRSVRAEVIAGRGEFAEARRLAEEAVSIAERTDKPVEHGNACLSLARVHRAAGAEQLARASAEKAASLFERKGAIALVQNARAFIGQEIARPVEVVTSNGGVVPDNACSRLLKGRPFTVRELYADSAVLDVRQRIRRSFVQAGDVAARLQEIKDRGVSVADWHLIATRGDRLALGRTTIRGTDPNTGGDFEAYGLALLRLNDDGLIDLSVAFDEDDGDAAFAELDEQFCAGEAAELAEVFRTVLREFHSPRIVNIDFVDHRPAGFGTITSPAQHERRIASVRELVADFRSRTVAVLALDRHGAVIQQHWSGVTADGAEVEWDHVFVLELTDGALVRGELFPIDATPAALARFAALRTGAPTLENAATRMAERARELLLEGRVDEYADLLSVDYLHDSRAPHAMFGEGNKAEHVAVIRAMLDTWQGIELSLKTIAIRGDRLFLATIRAADRSGFYRENLAVGELGEEGLLKASVYFDSDDFDAAFAELDRRFAEGEGAGSPRRFEQLERPAEPLDNAATRAGERVRTLMGERQLDELADQLSPDFVATQRTPNSIFPGGNKDEFVQMIRATGEAWGDVARESTTIAIRGDLLALTRFRMSDPAGFVRETISVGELTSDGLLKAIVYFDLDDLDTAFDELDRRYAEGEGAAFANRLRLMRHVSRIHNAHDWDAWQRFFADDVLIVDHRPGEWGTIRGIDAWMRHSKAIADVAPDAQWYTAAIHRVSKHGTLQHGVMIGTNQADGETRVEYLGLTWSRGGVVRSFELFPLEQLDAALARFDELERADRAALENAATRRGDELYRLVREERWDDIDGLFADGFVSDFRFPRAFDAPMDKGRMGSLIRNRVSFWSRMREAPVAIRGDRLCLVRRAFATEDREPGAPEMNSLLLRELDEAGLTKTNVWFKAGDLAEALEELDARYMAGEAAPFRETFDVVRQLTFVNSDAFSPDFVVVDHRSGSALGASSKEEWLDGLGDFPDRRGHVAAVRALDERGAVLQIDIRHGPDDAPFEWGLIFVRRVENGLNVRSDIFTDDQLDEALEWFATFDPRGPRLENAATRQAQLTLGLSRSHDWDAAAANLSEDFTWENRFPSAVQAGDKQMFIENVPTTWGIWSDLTETPIAIRGDRLALGEVVFTTTDSGPGAPEMMGLRLTELDDNGLIKKVIWFKRSELAQAIEELDNRYLAGEAAPFADVYRTVALDRTLAFKLAEDFVAVDHRGGRGFDTRTKDQFLESIRLLYAQMVKPETLVAAVHALDYRGAVVQFSVRETAADAAALEFGLTSVRWAHGGLIKRIDLFGDDVEGIAAALDCFAERKPRLENRLTRLAEITWQLTQQQKWDDVQAMLAPNFFADRSRDQMLGGATHPTFFDLWKFSRQVPIAIRGERLGLFRLHFETEDGETGKFTKEALVVREMNESGLMSAFVFFGPDRLDEAFDELDSRYLAGEGSAHEDVWRPITEQVGALNARDWDHWLTLFADEFAVTDHRSGSRLPDGDAEYFRNGIQLLIAPAPNVIVCHTVIHAIGHRAAWFSVLATGTTETGMPVEWGFDSVWSVREGRIVQTSLFSTDTPDQARAVFDQYENHC